MGKTKTAVITGMPDEKLTGKAAYEAKRQKKEVAKKKLESEKKKKQITKVGLKGGERIKTVEAGPIVEEAKKEEEIKKVTLKPKTRGKKYKAAKAKIDKTKFYKLANAIKLIKETSYSSFNGTVELHLTVKKEGLSVNVELPHTFGKTKKIEIANNKTIEKLKKASGPKGSGPAGKVDFDVLLATAEMMPKLVPFAKILGPKGLMPNPKNGTLIKDKADAKKFSANTLNIKTERKVPLIHTAVGKVNQKDNELEENAESIIAAVGTRQIVKAYLTSTMSPSVKLQT